MDTIFFSMEIATYKVGTERQFLRRRLTKFYWEEHGHMGGFVPLYPFDYGSKAWYLCEHHIRW